jgi:hypothetical protein
MGSFLDSLGLPDTRTLQEALFKTNGPADGRIKKRRRHRFLEWINPRYIQGPTENLFRMFARCLRK